MNKIFKVLFILSVASLICFAQVKPNSITKDIVELDKRGAGKKVGTITVTETANGVSIDLEAKGLALESGAAELHLYGNNSPQTSKDAKVNSVNGGGLGGHWDPDNTGTHAGPDGEGHRGDLEALTVNEDGSVNQTVVSAKIKYSDIEGKSFVIHANPDNYTDNPANGGSGARLYVAMF